MPDSVVLSPLLSTGSAVVWQPGAGLRCALRSNDGEVLERGRLLLSALGGGSDYEEAMPDFVWQIERPVNGEMWRAHGRTDLTPPFESDGLPELLMQVEYAALMGLLSRGTEQFFSLHAALLSKNGRSVVVVGPKEAGKSTLACALWTRRGWTLRGDDTVLIDHHNCARPAPRRVSLRSGSRVLLGEALWARLAELPSTLVTPQGLLFHPHELEAGEVVAPCEAAVPREPAAVFFLARRESRAMPARTVAIAPASAALALLPYSTFLLPRGEELLCPSRVEWGAALPRLAAFASRVPAFDLGRGPLEAMTEEVERLAFHENPASTS